MSTDSSNLSADSMVDLHCTPRLEATLDKPEEEQTAKHKSHSSLRGLNLMLEPQQNEAAMSSEEEDDAGRKSHDFLYTTKVCRDNIYAVLGGQLNNALTEQPKQTAYSKKAEKNLGLAEVLNMLQAGILGIPEESRLAHEISRDYDEQLHFDSLRKAQNGILVEVDEAGKLLKGANRKRGFCDADLDKLQNLQLLFRQSNIRSTRWRNDGVCTEEHLDAAREGARSQPPGAHKALFKAGHALSRMPGRSPGEKRKHRSASRESTPPQEIADGLISPPLFRTDALEVPDSEEELYENEGDIEHSKRIKRNATEILKQHHTETDIERSAKEEKEYAHAAYNKASDLKGLQKNKDAPKKKASWGESLLQRFHSNENSLPDYGRVTDSNAVHVTQAATTTMRGHLGGVRPRNTLGNDPHSISNSSFVLQQSNFNLHEDYTRRSDTHRHKKQKTEDRSASRTQAHKDVIELDTQSSYKKEGRSPRSSQSHTQNGLRKNGVVEYNAVEERVRKTTTRRKVNGLSNVQPSKSVGHQQHTRSRISKTKTLAHDGEDPEDPIIDADTSSPEIQYKELLGGVITPPYKGTANLRPTRELDDKGRRAPTTTRNETAITSPHFSVNGYRDSQKRRGSVMSNSMDITQNESSSMTREGGGVSAQKRSGSHLRGHLELKSLDVDEIGLIDDSHHKTAQVLLRKNKQLKGSLTANTQCKPKADNDTSGDELDNGDMITNSLTKTRKHRKTTARFQVIQVFSHRHDWLCHGLDNPWQLDQDLETGILKFFNADGHHVPDLDLMSKKFRKIHRNHQDGKLLIHKPADDTVKRAHQIHLQLANKDQSEDFFRNVRHVLPTIGTSMELDLDKVFAATRRKMVEVMPKPKRNENLENPQQEKRNREGTDRATSDKAQAANPKRSRMIEKMRKDDDSLPGTETIVRGRKTPPIDLEEFSRPSKAPRLSDSTPRATRSRNAIGELATRRATKPRSPSPERWTELNPDWVRLRNWHSSIIYPKEGKNKATVDKQDIERLDEGLFLNDNLIMFYLLKLERDLAERNPTLSKRVYFNNTFFYERLTKPVKGKKGINYEAVERWTSKVDLFSYDYIIVPVNEHSHWYVAIIYNAPKLLHPEHDVIEIEQCQEKTADAGKTQSESQAAHHSCPVSPSNAPTVSSSEATVGESMRKMTLKEEPVKERGDADSMKSIPVQATSKQHDGSIDGIRLDPDSTQEFLSQEVATIPTKEKQKPAKRGKRKSSTHTPRKFTPKEPKIITLDSLGLAHSATCINLRDYMVAEGRAKRNVEISPPRQLGMTAINIPTQKNYCDCGLFLLSYVERLLKDPDEFIEAVLGKVDIEVSYNFTKAPEMRNRIRELLFDLQPQRVAENAEIDLAKPQGSNDEKSFKPPAGFSKPAESGSRESSKSVCPSVESDHANSSRLSAQPALSKSESAQHSSDSWPNSRNSPHSVQPRQPSPSGSVVQMQLPHTRLAVSESLQDSIVIRSLEHDTTDLERETYPDPANVPKLASRQVTNVEEGADDSTRAFKSKEQGSVVSATFSSKVKPFRGLDKDSKKSKSMRAGESLTNALELDGESPRKDTQEHTAPDAALEEPRDLGSSLPEVHDLSPPVRGRASTPYPRALVSASPDIDEKLVEVEHPRTPLRESSETLDSPPLESAAKPPLPRIGPDVVDMTSEEPLVSQDQEMLLQPDAVSAPLLLDSPVAPTTPSRSVRKPRAATSPQRRSKRKSSSSQSPKLVNSGQRRPWSF